MKLNHALFSPDAPNTSTETGGGSQTPATKSDGITVSKEEYQAFVAAKAEAETLKTRASMLEENWNDAQKLLRTDLSPTETEAAMRRVLKAAGRSDADIEEQLASLRDDGDGAPSRRRGAGEEDPELAQTKAELRKHREELEQLKGSAQKNREDSLRGVLNTTVRSAVDSNKDLNMLIGKLAQVQDEDGTKTAELSSSIKETIRTEVAETLKKRLANRRVAARGQWDDAWIEAEGPAAAADVVKKYRGLVGDPSKLGRSAEVETGFESLATTQPVPAPSWKPGMKDGEVGTKVRNWAVDSLLRSAAEQSKQAV